MGREPPAPLRREQSEQNALIERDIVLLALSRQLESASAGGHVVLLAGEAGVGKTSVLQAIARRCPAVWWGGCDALQTPQPLRPWLDIAQQSQTRFAAALGGPRNALFDAVLDDLRLTASPLLVVIEDAHWADAATLDLIKFVGRRIARTRALLVISYRDDEVSMAHPLRRVIGELPAGAHTRLQLEPLSAAGVEKLARRSLRSPAGLFETTGGNPFFLTELLRYPTQQVPATVQDLVLARFARLDKPAQEIVRLVSVVPGRLERRLLQDILDPGVADLEACLDAGLLKVDGALIGFRHELARVAVESALSAALAQALHRQVLTSLQAFAPEAMARLAHHAAAARDAEAIRRYAPAAAQQARERGAMREAAGHLRNALREGAAGDVQERLRWLEAYALDSANVSWIDEAVAARHELEALYRAAGDAVAEGASLSRLALLHMYMLRNREANEASRRAIALLESQPPGAPLATAYGIEASLRMLNRDCEESVEWSRKSISLALKHGDHERLCYSLSTLGTALMFLDYDAGCRQLEEALDMARRQELPIAIANALLNLGSGSGELMRLEPAERWLRESIEFAVGLELDASADYSIAWMSLCAMYRGRWDEAGELAGRIAQAPDTTAISRVMALVSLGRLRQRRGDPGAQESLDRALELAGPADTLQRIAPVRAARAAAAFERGDLDAVAAEASAALPLAQAKRHPWFIGELAFWSWRAGKLTQAPAHCAAPYALQIDGDWQAAAAAWEQMGFPYEQASALADGDALAQQRALAIFERLGACPAANLLRKRLHSAGVQGIARGARPSTLAHAHGLTTREQEVLTLLCQGLRNGEIAERLNRSVRTVDHHVASVFAKLGVNSRLGAIRAAQREGLSIQFGQFAAPN